MNRKMKAIGVAALAACMCAACVLALPACGGSDDANTFRWFITKDDSNGSKYYSGYDNAIAIQYINQLTWDTVNGGIAKNGDGEKATLKFETPTVSASDSLGVMFASGDMDDLIDLSSSTDMPKKLVNDGALMEITDYVEKYMPHYTSYLNDNPDIKKFLTDTDDNGKVHYYALYGICDEPNDNYQGFCYRRDWLVKYAEVPSHIWDKETVLTNQNDYTSVDTSKIHYTNYYEAKENNDWTGWVENSITKFTSSEGDDPDNDYTDNVIFPSGNTDPMYISDWEWMLETFEGHVGSALTNSDSDYAALTIYYFGFNGAGDFFSSFGGGHPWWYVDTTSTVKHGGTSSTMKAYLECMQTWYNRGYVDRNFAQRNSDDFWKVNLSAFASGKIGMGQYGMAYPGTTIRATSGDSDAMVWGCSVPINDMYGNDENKFVIPDAMYSDSMVQTRNVVGISSSAKNKNLPLLFTMLDWFYTEEGSVLLTFGPNSAQYQELKASGISGNDTYAEYGLTNGTYTVEQVENDDGTATQMYKRVQAISDDSLLAGACNAQRITCKLSINGLIVSTYNQSLRHAMDEWKRYTNTTDITPYTTMLDTSDSKTYNTVYNDCMTYMAQTIPGFITKGYTDSDWSTYERNLNVLRGVNDVTAILQTMVDKLK